EKDLSSALLCRRRDRAIGEKLSGGITYQKLEGLADPMRKEVALARKEIDSVNK
ncbi:unnamed protein product, partial [Brassica oleracea var. botrytis]